MIHHIDHDLWFDSTKLYIVSGENKKLKYEEQYDSFPESTVRMPEHFRPTIIYLSSLSCNLKCTYCYADSGTYGYDQNGTKLSFKLDDYIDTYKYFFVKYNGVKAINFFGGEPLLNFDEIEKFVIYLHENYKNEDIPILSVASNGTIMDNRVKAFLKNYNIHFGTSLDGPKELNDLFRLSDYMESVYDKVNDTLSALPRDEHISKGLQMTISRPHIENYKKNDIISWLKDLESKNINYYELVPVMSEKSELKIDLNDEKILNNYKQMCNDYADYLINLLTQIKKVPMSNLVIGIMTRIMKREYQNDCSAGWSFSITPDRIVYPCHAFTSMSEFGVKFDEFFEKNLSENMFFSRAIKANRTEIDKCDKCIGRNLCSYWCKGFAYDNNADSFKNTFDERCILIQIFVRKIIKFLNNDYKTYKDIVDNNIRYYHKIGNNIAQS